MKTMKAMELKKCLDKQEVLLIDVREPAEHRAESIDGACLIPLGEIALEKLPSKSMPIVIHCRFGKRSADACKKLLAQDPTLEIYYLEGGMMAWQQAGFNIKKSDSTILPLDRQTQLTVGFLAFTGTILGAVVASGFYILPGIMGLGLMFAGLTGWCGMARLLAKMPWNR